MGNTDVDDRVGRVTDMLQESSLGRWNFINQAIMNDTMYLGHIPETEVPLPGLSYILINKTNQAIISHAQIQVETRPKTIVLPRQTATLPEYWMTRRGLSSIKAAIDQGLLVAFEEDMGESDDLLGEALPPEEDDSTEVDSEGFSFDMLNLSDADSFMVTEAFMQRVGPLMQPWIAIDGTEMAPLLTEKDITMVDDAMTAKCVQNNLDVSWEMDDRDLWLRNDIVNCLKFGTQGVMFTFDKENRKCKVFDIHVLNLFMPPNCTNVKDADYVIVREITSSKDAKERFPYAAKQIEEFQQRNTDGVTTLTSTFSDQAPYQGVYFGREMIELWHIWLRHEKFPMSPDDAIDNGRVVMRGDKMFLTDDDYNVTDEETDPTQKNWPKKLGIRYQQMVATEMVYDEECAHCDIPVVLNQNIPVSFSPWHQGEPERLWFCQKLIDKLSSIIIDHLTYFRSPQQILPASVYKRLKGLSTVYSHPARDAWLDDATFDNYREFFASGRGFYVDPPTVTAQYVELWQLALQLFDELSGHTGVLQGRAPGANSSGKLVEELQTAAKQSVSFKAASTENMLRQIARLEIDAWSKWMPLFQWKKANDELPVSTLQAIRRRSREMEFNVVIELASGAGSSRKERQAQAFEEAAEGARSWDSYRKLAGYHEEDKEWVQQREAAAQAAAAQPQQPVAA